MVKAASLTVFSSVDPSSLVSQHHPQQQQPETNPSTLISKEDQALDAMDHFNHTRQRRALILKELWTRKQQQQQDDSAASVNIQFEQPAPATVPMFHQIYGDVHSEGLLTFLETAWSQWEKLGEEGQDPLGYHHTNPVDTTVPRPFVPPNIPLRRAGPTDQRPSQHVLGQVGYYCTDTCTPIFHKLQQELLQDAALVHAAVERALGVSDDRATVSYIVPTHPGHHAAQDCFGGYCYVNHAAALAQNLSSFNNTNNTNARVAVLDVDYHCGNGTASIFDASDDVLVVSLHCDPNHDYPFHSGFADQTGSAPGNTTLHLPMPPGTTWEQDYRSNLERGLDAVVQFNPSTLIVSLGLDTYDQDPCAMRRAGFRLQGSDYVAMGQAIAEKLVDRATTTHVIFVQEGGYRLTQVPEAATNVVLSFCAARHA